MELGMDPDPARIERLECIGRGSYGDVYRGVDTHSGQQVAVKVIDLEDIEDDIEDIHKEISALAGCRSAHITRYYGALVAPGSSELLILMELLACSVADLLAGSPLPEAGIAFVLRGVLAALDYLHGESRIHRDIKAANVLLSGGGEVKISDFGVSGQLTGTLGYRRRTFVGTPYWMAPEVIESSEEGYSTSADIWSVGITAIEMAQAAPPHAELHPMRVLFIIPKDPPPRLEGDFSADFKDFVTACLQKDPARRPSARELLQHPFVAGATEVPPGLLQMVGEYGQRKRPVVAGQRGPSPSEYSAGTLPTWDFGGNKAAATTGRHAAALGTLRGVDPRHLTGGSSVSTGGSGGGGGPGGYVGSLAGTVKAAAAPAAAANGTGTVARADGWAMQQQLGAGFTGTLPSGTDAAAARAAAAAAAAAAARGEGQWSGAEQAGSSYGGTMPARGGSSMRDDSFGRQAGGDEPGPGPASGGAGGGGDERDRAVYRRLPSLQALSVDVGHVPGGGVAAGLPAGAGQAPEVTILRRFTRQESGAAAVEGDAVLSRLLLPALRALLPVMGGPEQAAVDGVVAQLQGLERQLPGGSARLLSEAMLLLSISDSPHLAKLLASARCIFGGGAAAAAGPASGGAAAAAGAPAASMPSPGPQRPGAAGGGTGAPGGGAAAALPGGGPDLGLLGNFLLASWREDAARCAASKAAAAARTRTGV
ncbi:MAG: kinase-like domain-containing protein [Monoraphidium minutum]|nr:MAG: kinase-like domain-containing protein [Monoraphidium minutum]